MPGRKSAPIGKWRIVGTALWDADFLDMLEPAYIAFDANGGGEFVFGAVHGDLDCRYGPDGVRFTWQGFDGMDPVSGAGSRLAGGELFRSLLALLRHISGGLRAWLVG
jgi:hypothetical protein